MSHKREANNSTEKRKTEVVSGCVSSDMCAP